MKASVLVVACVLLVGCQPQPAVDLTPLQVQIAELQGSVKALQTPPLPESIPFQIGAYKYANVECVVMLNRETGETWTLIKGSTNHPPGWVPLVVLERVDKNQELPAPPPGFELDQPAK